MDFFVELKGKKLVRGLDGLYTLNDTNLDRFFGINSCITLTPNKHNIANLAAMNYLFGLFGLNASSFVAIAAGYLVSYSKDDKFYGTFMTLDHLQAYIPSELLKLCRQESEKSSNDEDRMMYSNIEKILSDKNLSLLEKSLCISSFIKENGITKFDEKISKSILVYQNSNQKNCDDNHFVLCKIISDGNDEFAEDLNKIKDENVKHNSLEKEYVEKLMAARCVYNNVLNNFILPGYLHIEGLTDPKQLCKMVKF